MRQVSGEDKIMLQDTDDVGWDRVAALHQKVRNKGSQGARDLDQTASRRGASVVYVEASKARGDSICVVARRYMVEEVVQQSAKGRSDQRLVGKPMYGRVLKVWSWYEALPRERHRRRLYGTWVYGS